MEHEICLKEAEIAIIVFLDKTTNFKNSDITKIMLLEKIKTEYLIRIINEDGFNKVV